MKAVAYYRVSTSKQSTSGLGLEAQQATVKAFCQREGLDLIDEFTEVESGKGYDALKLRPKLEAAFKQARLTGSIIVVSKLDRLSRNVAFVAALMEQKVKFYVAELGMDIAPEMLQLMAVFAERERKAISERTSAALQAKKARGELLGNRVNLHIALQKSNLVITAKADEFANRLGKIINPMLASGMSRCSIAKRLNELGVPTARGGVWEPTTVTRILERL